jgi:hypothetical protein
VLLGQPLRISTSAVTPYDERRCCAIVGGLSAAPRDSGRGKGEGSVSRAGNYCERTELDWWKECKFVRMSQHMLNYVTGLFADPRASFAQQCVAHPPMRVLFTAFTLLPLQGRCPESGAPVWPQGRFRCNQ